jgi:VCBS repeat-containing protein
MRYEDASQSGSFQDQGPIARDDADQLAAGDRGPATGNLISGAGTETGATGADSGTGARVTAVAGAGGQDNSFAAGQLRVEGEHGSLSVTARGDYVYRLKADVPENSRDTFTYTLSDSAGADSQARLTIEIGRTQAVVAANAQRIVPGPDGVVVLPAGVELSDIRVSGRDLLVMLPDGTQMVIVDGAVFVPQLVINDIEVPSTNLAALLIEQEPRPASGVPQSGGGNFATPVGPLDPGAPLGDLLAPTELRYAPPEFRQLGLDEDRRPEVGSNPLVQIDDDVRTGGNAGGIGDDADGVNRNGVLSGSGGDGSLAFALSLAGAPAGFTYVAGANGALLVQQGGVTVLTVTLDARSGAYSVTQNAPIQHAPGSNENNVTFTFGYTVTDRDGDNAAGNFQVDVDDDTPVIDVTAGADAGVTLTTDDADTGGAVSDAVSSSANFGAVFGLTQSAGGDGQSSAGLSFALSTSGGPSGLTQGGVGINLYLIGGKIVGSTATSAAGVTAANSVFDVSVSSTGVVTLTQYSHIDHGNADPSPTGAPFNDQLVTLADNLVTLTASGTISDRDGDSASDSVSVQIGANLRFTDDGPSLAGVSVGAGVVLDETDAGFPISATSASAVIDASALSFGADGAAATSATSYAISVVGGGTTPLRTAAGDFAISLVQTSASIITGTYVEGGVTKTAFTVTINANGTVTVQQFVALEHTIDGSTLAAFDDALDLAGLVNATITIRDFDGDTASATAGIGNLVSFRDDGPDSRLNVEAPRDVLVLDETQPVGSDTQGASAPTGVASVTANFADNFAAASFGADGAGSVSYALVLNGSNVASGLHALDASGAATRGAEILLNQQGNVVTGSADGVALFTIAVDPATGIVTFTQLGPVWNPAAGASFDEAAFLRLAEGSLLLRQTVTDSDGDSDATSIDIGQGQFQIQDDGPIARADTDEVVAGAYGPETGNVLTGAGTTSGAAGADMAGRDGASVVAVRSGERSDASFDAAGNLVVQGQHGVLTLRADGSYSYVRNSGTPGGVDDVFTYTLRDGDGDTSDATLTIRIGNMAPTVNAPDAGAEGTLVHEAALGERGAGEAIGSGEEALAGADGDPREATQGIIRIGQGDGPATVTIAGVTITGTGQVIDTGEGLLTVTAIATGQLSYSYQLKDNQLANGGSVVDSFEVTVTDRDGDVARDTLAITIVDDAAVANDDRDMVAAGKFGPETGNVITGEGTIFSGKDVVGADGASLVSVSGRSGMDDVFDADGNLTVSGQYGVLTIKADGSYSYLRNAGTPGGVEDVFTYTLRDGDGDLDTATLTIGIGDEQPRIEAPNIGSDGTVVHEAALSGDRGVGESEGSGEAAAEGPNGDGRETVEGSILIGRGDGSATITIGGVTLTEVGQVIDTGEGLLTITAIGRDAIGYSYTLKDNVSGQGDRIDEIALTITDADGDVARDTLTITIRDDAPIATSDTDSLGHADLRATGNVLTGVDPAGGDRNATDGTADLAGADGASLTAIASNNRPANAATTDAATGDLLVTGQYGTLRIAANGDYSYSRHDGAPVAGTDVFTYTLTDGDGDKSTATLTIGLDDAGVAIAIPEAGSAATTVFEAALGTAPQGSSEAAFARRQRRCG